MANITGNDNPNTLYGDRKGFAEDDIIRGLGGDDILRGLGGVNHEYDGSDRFIYNKSTGGCRWTRRSISGSVCQDIDWLSDDEHGLLCSRLASA